MTPFKVGQALSLDGVDDYMDAGDFEIGGAVTLPLGEIRCLQKLVEVFDFGNG